MFRGLTRDVIIALNTSKQIYNTNDRTGRQVALQRRQVTGKVEHAFYFLA